MKHRNFLRNIKLNSGITGILISVVLLSASGNPAYSRTGKNGNPVLVTCQWLDENLKNPDLVILHVATIKRNYENGHIPGARYLWPGWLSVSTETESTVPASLDGMKKVLEELGVSNNSGIVLCGSSGNLVVVARMFVTLEYIGLAGQVSILQGGIEEWETSGHKLTAETPVFKKGMLKVSVQDNFVDADWVLKNLNNKNYQIVDARSKSAFDGQKGSRQGHIPGSLNLPASDLYDGKTWHFISDEKIMDLFKKLEIPADRRPVFYCNTGNSASIDYVAAVMAGYRPIIYDGSMEDWSSRSDLPVENQ